ncbi:efflux RND transporter periplasmic adaptor subunit [Synechococcus sp. FGCU-3]|nr:efflux RND transporter periplasmic adaptor subunit [Synechococcus sp. FGCU3]
MVPAPNSEWRRRRLLQRRRVWAGAAVGVALLAAVGVWQRQQSGAVKNLDQYTVLAEPGTLPGVVTATGELQAVQRVNVTPKRGGVLEALFVEEGNQVTAGQPIARMDSGDLDDRIAEFRSNLKAAEAQLIRTRSEWERRRDLYRGNAITMDDYNRALSAYKADEAAVQAARERLQQRQVELRELVVRAPFSGIITQRYADPGSFVTPTTTAAAVAGATSSSIVELAQGLEVVAKVPESDIGRIRLGQPADVRVDAFPDRRFAAAVKRITPRAVKLNNVTSFDVVLRFMDAVPQLRIGMTADVDFKTGSVRANTLVPTVAIVTEDGRPGVLVPGKRNKPEFQPVELGISGGRSTQILSGLKPGSRVFINLPPGSKRDKN